MLIEFDLNQNDADVGTWPSSCVPAVLRKKNNACLSVQAASIESPSSPLSNASSHHDIGRPMSGLALLSS